jgi:D-alanyl-lipoteichoic acid acyltransferase DltB (MBOAT superfamily)
MTLGQILVFAVLSLVIGRWANLRWRPWLLMVFSLLAIYWLQPGMPLRYMDFWLPTLALALTVWVWAATRSGGLRQLSSADLGAAGLILVVVLLIGLTRYVAPLCCLTATRPPPVSQIGLGLVFVAGLGLFLRLIRGNRSWILGFGVIFILIVFVILKTEPLTTALSAAVRGLMQQDVALASALDVRWLGFSYIAFRLLHVLRDRMAGRLPDTGLGELVSFILFFPALTAGPIDRIQRFSNDFRHDFRLDSPQLLEAGERLVWGIFKKFVLANALTLLALNAFNANQIQSPFWMWVVVYAYALLIYFDFSGYTDVAIGLGLLSGIRLPENFSRPYLQKNLTQFWNSWHMTLANWFRAYYFNPLTRALRGARSLPVGWIILTGQLSTMVLLGLWHGVTWNFAIWGAWHGLGLFLHNRWSEFLRRRDQPAENSPWRQRLLNAGGTLLTFHYVALGWVWFVLPTPQLAWRVWSVLLGLG